MQIDKDKSKDRILEFTIMQITNKSTIDISDNEQKKICAAVTRQLVEHFSPAWFISQQPVEIVIKDWSSGQSSAMHAWVNNHIYIEIYAKQLEQLGRPLSMAISHEVLEAHANPNGILNYLIDHGNGTGTLYLREPCNPVENTSYEINAGEGRVVVSNFVFPSFFTQGAGPWDYLGKITTPLTPLEGQRMPTQKVFGLPSLFSIIKSNLSLEPLKINTLSKGCICPSQKLIIKETI